jgi:hypothetical protein
MIAPNMYQTGLKYGKSTAIYTNRLLNEGHDPRKREFNLIDDLGLHPLGQFLCKHMEEHVN